MCFTLSVLSMSNPALICSSLFWNPSEVKKKIFKKGDFLSSTKRLMDRKGGIIKWFRSWKLYCEDKWWGKILPLCWRLDPLNGMANCPGYHGYEKVGEHINHKDLGFSFSFIFTPKKESESPRRPFMKLIYDVQYLCVYQGSPWITAEQQEVCKKAAFVVGNSLCGKEE